MTAAMQKILSADLEALSGVTLEQALLNSTPRRLVDQVEDIVDRLAADRLLIGAIAAYGLEPDTFGPVETDWPEIAYTLQDVAVRLVTALEETRTLVKADHKLETAQLIVRLARAEGRIPPEDVVAERQEALDSVMVDRGSP